MFFQNTVGIISSPIDEIAAVFSISRDNSCTPDKIIIRTEVDHPSLESCGFFTMFCAADLGSESNLNQLFLWG
jgi:hypothetical protein